MTGKYTGTMPKIALLERSQVVQPLRYENLWILEETLSSKKGFHPGGIWVLALRAGSTLPGVEANTDRTPNI